MSHEIPLFGRKLQETSVFAAGALLERTCREETFFRHPDGPIIHMLNTPQDARETMADDVLDILENACDGDTVLLSTGNSSKAFYETLVKRASQRSVDLARFTYGHIDNYVYDPVQYPEGTDQEDFEKFLLQHFIGPAGIPEDRFFPIKGLTENPQQTAEKYSHWLTNQHVVVALTGAMGPEPESHIAFMTRDMDPESPLAVVALSQETVERDRARAAQNNTPPPPEQAITIGLPVLRNAEHIYNINCGDEYVSRVKLALTGPIDPSVISTYYRSQGIADHVNFYLDEATAKPVREAFFI